MPKSALLQGIVRFLIAYSVTLTASLLWGERYVEFLLPAYRWEIAIFMPEYRIVSLGIHDIHGESAIRLTLELVRYLSVGSQLFPPGGIVFGSTLTGQALQHPIVLLSLVVAWPARDVRERTMSLLAAIPFLLLLEWLDIPWVLMGSVQDLVFARVAPDETSAAIIWMNFLNGGGRFALAIAAALGALGCGRFIVRGFSSNVETRSPSAA